MKIYFRFSTAADLFSSYLSAGCFDFRSYSKFLEITEYSNYEYSKLLPPVVFLISWVISFLVQSRFLLTHKSGQLFSLKVDIFCVYEVFFIILNFFFTSFYLCLWFSFFFFLFYFFVFLLSCGQCSIPLIGIFRRLISVYVFSKSLF